MDLDQDYTSFRQPAGPNGAVIVFRNLDFDDLRGFGSPNTRMSGDYILIPALAQTSPDGYHCSRIREAQRRRSH